VAESGGDHMDKDSRSRLAAVCRRSWSRPGASEQLAELAEVIARVHGRADRRGEHARAAATAARR
jgi:hypothetical protein